MSVLLGLNGCGASSILLGLLAIDGCSLIPHSSGGCHTLGLGIVHAFDGTTLSTDTDNDLGWTGSSLEIGEPGIGKSSVAVGVSLLLSVAIDLWDHNTHLLSADLNACMGIVPVEEICTEFACSLAVPELVAGNTVISVLRIIDDLGLNDWTI